jgi:hypothetical protein
MIHGMDGISTSDIISDTCMLASGTIGRRITVGAEDGLARTGTAHRIEDLIGMVADITAEVTTTMDAIDMITATIMVLGEGVNGHTMAEQRIRTARRDLATTCMPINGA